MVDNRFNIKLNTFEGPIDLLWFLIKKNEINIYDIPISFILKQFLEWIELMKKLDIEIASDFIYFASLLMSIKSRMLLPFLDEDEEEYEDPRMELINLLEYRKIKNAAKELKIMEEENRDIFKREYFKFIKEEKDYNDDLDINVYQLVKAYKNVIEKEESDIVLKFKRIEYSLTEQIRLVLNILKNREKIVFDEIFDDLTDKLFIAVTFLAILELAKLRAVILNQSKPFKNIWIKKGEFFENSGEMF